MTKLGGYRIGAWSGHAMNSSEAIRGLVELASSFLGKNARVKSLLEDDEEDLESHATTASFYRKIGKPWKGRLFVLIENADGNEYGHFRIYRLNPSELSLRCYRNLLHEFEMDFGFRDCDEIGSNLRQICRTMNACYGYATDRNMPIPTAGTEGVLFGLPPIGWQTYLGPGFRELAEDARSEVGAGGIIVVTDRDIFIQLGDSPADTTSPVIASIRSRIVEAIGAPYFVPEIERLPIDNRTGGLFAGLSWLVGVASQRLPRAKILPRIDRRGLGWKGV